ncbi:MAG: hypothetical protein ACYC46_13335 [Acidobacteriaceae bacterium]
MKLQILIRVLAFLLVLFALPACGYRQQDAANALIEKADANGMQQDEHSAEYTFLDRWSNSLYDPLDHSFSLTTAQYQVLFIAGIPFRKELAMDGKVLRGDALAAENRRYDEAVARVKQMTQGEKLQYVQNHQSAFSLDIHDLLRLHRCGITGHIRFHNRQVTVIACKLRHEIVPTDRFQKRLMHESVKLWIDQQDSFVTRAQITLLNDRDAYASGSKITFEWSKLDGVWHQTLGEVEYVGTGKYVNVRGDVKDVFSHFQKFAVNVHMLPGFRVIAPVVSNSGP